MTDAQSEQEQNTVMAMFLSVKVNQQVMKQQMQQKLAQKQQSDQQWRAWGQQQSDRIRAQGEAAQKNFADRQAANDAQHAQWNAGQINNSRNIQGFSNYLLDQTVVEDNNMYGNGTVGHGTLWNSTADALVKADPNRFSYVNVPNYWQGTDFQP
jgi:regulator of protease activity HflC (stomatin/prohibitin superfamily)